ncbi:hypothetical protein [Rubellicoccus peritrichatus]|uniref:Uncharacterized protein n=1 Tax=Rubellicoccus peritrichatus TaxID=3080537 RepID=A0AAQ3LBI9_9BACT|nr:hypothetical protein [Puniceicoccus sp. CR14]WOO43064.1 hypothetical protein RZN69_08155 [Puniceicoccus sp. CR14]
MSEDENQKLIEFVEEQTKKAQRGVKTTYVLGIIAAVLIGGYLSFILYMERTFLNPQNLAYLIRLETEAAMPQLIRDTEDALVEKARSGAQSLSDEFIELVPRIAAAGKEQIDIAYQEQIPFLSEEFSLIVEEYIDQNGEELAAFAEEHSSQEFANYFTAEMMDELHRQLDTRMAQEYEGRGVAYFKENIVDAMVAMDYTVSDLLTKNPEDMNRRERLQRRLLARLVTSAIDSSDLENQ